METPLQVTNLFSLAAFKIHSLSLTFGILIMSWCGPLWTQLVQNSLCFLDLYVQFLHQIKEVIFHYFFKQISNFLLFLFSFWHPYDVNVGLLRLSQRLLTLSSFFFSLLLPFLIVLMGCFLLPQVPNQWFDFSALFTPLLFPCKLFFYFN